MTKDEAITKLRELFGELHETYTAQKHSTAEMLQLCVEELENPSRARGDLIVAVRTAIKLLKGEEA